MDSRCAARPYQRSAAVIPAGLQESICTEEVRRQRRATEALYALRAVRMRCNVPSAESDRRDMDAASLPQRRVLGSLTARRGERRQFAACGSMG